MSQFKVLVPILAIFMAIFINAQGSALAQKQTIATDSSWYNGVWSGKGRDWKNTYTFKVKGSRVTGTVTSVQVSSGKSYKNKLEGKVIANGFLKVKVVRKGKNRFSQITLSRAGKFLLLRYKNAPPSWKGLKLSRNK
jgi:hypothetical protein